VCGICRGLPHVWSRVYVDFGRMVKPSHDHFRRLHGQNGRSWLVDAERKEVVRQAGASHQNLLCPQLHRCRSISRISLLGKSLISIALLSVDARLARPSSVESGTQVLSSEIGLTADRSAGNGEPLNVRDRSFASRSPQGFREGSMLCVEGS